jgi:hypothetical protein
MIACLDFNRFPQNSGEADSDFRDLCQLFNNIILDSIYSDFQRQLFINIKAYSNFSRFLISILQLNKKSSAFRMVVNKHKFIIKSKMPSTFQLIVGCKQRGNRSDFWLPFGYRMPFYIMDPANTSQAAFPYWQRVPSHDLKFSVISSLLLHHNLREHDLLKILTDLAISTVPS